MVANCRVSLPPVVSDGHAQLAFSTNQPQLVSSWPYYQCENFTYGFVLDHFNLAVIPTPSHRPVFDCCQFSDKNSHLTSKTANWLCWLSRKVQHTPTQTSQNWAQFRKAQLTQVYFFPLISRTGSYVHKPTRYHNAPIIVPRMEPSYTPFH